MFRRGNSQSIRYRVLPTSENGWIVSGFSRDTCFYGAFLLEISGGYFFPQEKPALKPSQTTYLDLN